MKTKFRAWDEVSKIMHFNFQFIKSGDEWNDWIIFSSDKQKLSKENVFNNPYFSRQLKIMQFIRKRDKNDVEIYSGDIVKGVGEHEGCSEVFIGGGFELQPFSYLNDYDGNNFEVIGDIWQNPELLEKIKKD